MEIQTVIVTGNWVDLLIELVTIHSVGEGPCSDTMEYITITLTQNWGGEGGEGFMAYQPLEIIQCQILFINIY